MAFLVLLESLSPVERAVFLLREVFDYGYDEIAAVVGKSEENCRQIAVRARRQVEAKKPRFEASRRRREELARRFFEAVGEGDTDSLIRLLAADVVAYADGGGKTRTFLRPMYGRERIARIFLESERGWSSWAPRGCAWPRSTDSRERCIWATMGGPSWSFPSTSPRDSSRPSAPSAIRRSFVTWARAPVAAGRLIAELEVEVPFPGTCRTLVGDRRR